MMAMRRAGILLVAAGYGLSFLVVCLGACFATAPDGDEHACCADEGFRATARDCCSVTPGASPESPVVAKWAPRALVAPVAEVIAQPVPLPRGASARAAASPPLVLRI
jgi:hypothetical protein